MIRRLFTATSVLSLLMFVAVVALWARSRYVRDMLQNQVEDRLTFMGQSICESETLGLGVGEDTWNNVNHGKGWHLETVPASSVLTSGAVPKAKSSLLGFWYVNGQHFSFVILPFWSLMAVTGLLPAVWLERWVRTRRPKSR